jgi:hypothetical protein
VQRNIADNVARSFVGTANEIRNLGHDQSLDKLGNELQSVVKQVSDTTSLDKVGNELQNVFNEFGNAGQEAYKNIVNTWG